MENWKIIHGDANNELKEFNENIHLVITDPPYFIDGMDDNWDEDELATKSKKAGVVGSLPIGMKFDANQGIKLQEFMEPIAKLLFNALIPGGFCIVFSQARLYGRMSLAFENAGFEIRDMLIWKYTGQAKAFSQDHFIEKKYEKGLISREEADRIIESLGNRKTPQLLPRHEPMILAQKPKEGTFVDNWVKYKTGLIDTSQRINNLFPSNVIEVSKPKKENYNKHLTVKPIRLIRHLIKVFSTEGQIILDPFVGSGTHVLAAVLENRIGIGIEKEKKYCEIAKERLQKKANNDILFVFE